MIIVIADDFTGAAEIAALGLRYDLKAEVHTRFDPDKITGELISIDTDTRSLPPADAASVLHHLATQISQLPVTKLYKKVDSVLRGPVLAELKVLADELGSNRVLLLPANPSKGRIIKRGRYFVDDRPIDRTEFGSDPEYPARSSRVIDMLGDERSIRLSTVSDPTLPKGIVVGDASCQADLEGWAARLDSQTLPAGAAEFFSTLLMAWKAGLRSHPAADFDAGIHLRTLFVSGSSSSSSRNLSERFKVAGIPVLSMPAGLASRTASSQQPFEKWAKQALSCLASASCVRVSIDLPLQQDPSAPALLTGYLVNLVCRLLSLQRVDQLWVEGGATVSALVRRLGWSPLMVRSELGPGTVALQPTGRNDPMLVTKPGSYTWPEHFLSRFLRAPPTALP